MGKNQHVVTHSCEWAVWGERNEKVTSIHPTQAEAIERAREIAIHGRAGKIRDKDSYGPD